MAKQACGQCETLPHSCGHRSCPHCWHHEGQQWRERQRAKLLPVDYFMVTFTLPRQLRPLAWHHQRLVYALLLKLAWQTLSDFGLNDARLQGKIGAHAVLRGDHEFLHPGRAPVAPSAIHCEDCKVFTVDDQGRGGLAATSPPHALTLEEIQSTVTDYARAARNAMAAGFDGVEVHAANGYLPHQFLASNTNQRDDAYGGDLSGRCRFLFEMMDAVLSEMPAGRVGVRLSSLFGFNGIKDADPAETQGHVAAHLDSLKVAYLHVADTDVMGGADPKMDAMLPFMRPRFGGVTILNGAYDPHRASTAVAAGDGDLVAFGRLYLANPDLPERILQGGPYNDPDPATFYGGGVEGYTDYPVLGRQP